VRLQHDRGVKAAITCLIWALSAVAPAVAAESPPTPGASGTTGDELEEVVVTAPEPRYVAPTNRDRIGRVWVPVLINERQVFRLVLDSGATRSAVTAAVAHALEIPLDRSPPVLLRGVTGSAVVPTIQVDSISVGDLYVGPATLPIVADAFGGAEGLLGTDGMQDKRIYIDFRHDFINISRSKGRRAAPGFDTVPFLKDKLKLLIVNAEVGNMPVRAIIDTGAQASIGNSALQQALLHMVARNRGGQDEITGATGDMQTGIGARISRIAIGDTAIQDAHVTFGDMNIFEHWKLGKEPAILIGMDVLGLLDTLIIDYRRQELQIKRR
jgi:predicted aspartyl protease